MIFDCATILLRSVRLNIRKDAQTRLHRGTPTWRVWAPRTTTFPALRIYVDNEINARRVCPRSCNIAYFFMISQVFNQGIISHSKTAGTYYVSCYPDIFARIFILIVHPLAALIRLLLTLSWWRHQMETFSALLAICVGNSPVPGEFPTQRPVTLSFDVFFDLRPNKRLSKQWWGWWFETPSCPSWRHSNVPIPARPRTTQRTLIPKCMSYYNY